MQGEWQVEKVFINTETERTLNYQFNDDRLVGRFLSVTPQGISTTLPGGSHCQSPSMEKHSSTLDAWVANTQSLPEEDAAKIYEPGLDGNTKIQAENIICASGHFTSGDVNGDVSQAFVNQRLLLNWTDGTILLLSSVDKNSKPQTSFDCAKADSVEEKAICGDRELAALDNSVARSYKAFRQEAVLTGNNDLENKIQSQQKAWLSQRNSCNGDVQCLKKLMNNRPETPARSLDEI